MLTKILLVAAGGGVGSALRYLIQLWMLALAGPRFPWGTLVVNCTGCFAIGLLAVLLTPAGTHPELRLLLIVGLLGGYTTFSTFGIETLDLLTARQWALAALNLLLSNACGLLAVWLGQRIAGASAPGA